MGCSQGVKWGSLNFENLQEMRRIGSLKILPGSTYTLINHIHFTLACLFTMKILPGSRTDHESIRNEACTVFLGI